jgi:hypothetical protein
MKLFRLVATILLFLLPAMSLSIDPTGKLCWFICLFYLFLHVFFIKYVKLTHQLDAIQSPINITIK